MDGSGNKPIVATPPHLHTALPLNDARFGAESDMVITYLLLACAGF